MTINPEEILAALGAFPPVPDIEEDEPGQAEAGIPDEAPASPQEGTPAVVTVEQIASVRLHVIASDMSNLASILTGPDKELQAKLTDGLFSLLPLLVETVQTLRGDR